MQQKRRRDARRSAVTPLLPALEGMPDYHALELLDSQLPYPFYPTAGSTSIATDQVLFKAIWALTSKIHGTLPPADAVAGLLEDSHLKLGFYMSQRQKPAPDNNLIYN